VLLLEVAKKTRSSWGCDFYWCAAADHYARKHAQLQFYAKMDEQQFLNQTANSVGEPVFLYNLTTRYVQLLHDYQLCVE
jgi:hypothetical protein